jgi:predicted small lipoprotein YifL
MRKRSWLPVAMTCTGWAGTALVGCGQTGNLYLPDAESELVVAQPEASATTDADTDRKRTDEQRQPAPQ